MSMSMCMYVCVCVLARFSQHHLLVREWFLKCVAVLQLIAVCCGLLQCVAVRQSIELQCSLACTFWNVCCNVLQYVAEWSVYNAHARKCHTSENEELLQCFAACCNVLHSVKLSSDNSWVRHSVTMQHTSECNTLSHCNTLISATLSHCNTLATATLCHTAPHSRVQHSVPLQHNRGCNTLSHCNTLASATLCHAATYNYSQVKHSVTQQHTHMWESGRARQSECRERDNVSAWVRKSALTETATIFPRNSFATFSKAIMNSFTPSLPVFSFFLFSCFRICWKKSVDGSFPFLNDWNMLKQVCWWQFPIFEWMCCYKPTDTHANTDRHTHTNASAYTCMHRGMHTS